MHSPEPGRDISLGSSQIPRICVLWETHTRRTVAPARRPVPGPPVLLPQRPAYARGPCSGVPAASVLRTQPPGRGAKGGTGSVDSRRGHSGLGDPSPERGLRPAWPSPRRPEWGRGPTRRPDPHPRLLTEPLPSEWSSLNIHFMAAAGKGCSRLSEPRNSAHQPQQQRRQWQQRRRLHGRRDFRLPEPSNHPGAGLPALLARTPSHRARPHSRRRGRRWLCWGLPGEVGMTTVATGPFLRGFGDWEGVDVWNW